nr:type VI secretion system baseplate subunit TssE [Pseudoduganella umbonata]
MSRDRLQPALLDRLSDDASGTPLESREQRVLSLRGLREAVLRDLGWLLNATSLAAAVGPLDDTPLAAQSVLNFGLPGLAGRTASSVDAGTVARAIRQAIWDFEPRILRDGLRVVAVAGHPSAAPNQLAFEIQGELWALPLPERLYVRTELDLETGAVRLFDLDGARPR